MRRRDLLRAAMTGPLIAGLSDEERATLERVAHTGSPAAVRAAILLACTEPVPAPRIARRLGVSQRAVLRAAWRYHQHGVDELVNPLA
ncbi:MAG TPA: hypothetical protein VG708_11860 [Mycobacteriales bacterium]|nr:hypothetical protein [Mycobacteriales bacterium]